MKASLVVEVSHSSLNINKAMWMLATADKQKVRWYVPSDAEKPLLENINPKQLLKKSTNPVSFIKFCFSRAQKQPFLKYFPYNIFGILLLSEIGKHAFPLNSWRGHLIRPASQKGQVRFSMFVSMWNNALQIWIGVSLNSHLLYLFI